MVKILFIIFTLLLTACDQKQEVRTISRKQINTIKSKLDHYSSNAKIEGAEEVIGFGPAAIEAVPSLMLNLSSRDNNVKRFTLAALTAIGPRAENATKLIIPILKDECSVCAKKAAEALIAIRGEKGTETIFKFLKKTLKELEDYSDPAKRIRAAQIFGRLGPYAEAAVQYLGERLIYDKDSLVRKTSADSLGQIGSIDGVPYLMNRLKHHKPIVTQVIRLDNFHFFQQKSVYYSVYSLDTNGLMKVGGEFPPKKMKELRKKPYSHLLFLKKSHIMYLDKRAEYKPYFDKSGRSRNWATFVYIYSKQNDNYTKIKKSLIPSLDKNKNDLIPGKKYEPYRYVRDASAYAIELITGTKPPNSLN